MNLPPLIGPCYSGLAVFSSVFSHGARFCVPVFFFFYIVADMSTAVSLHRLAHWNKGFLEVSFTPGPVCGVEREPLCWERSGCVSVA